jgi:AbrB family looped-hinge helix DNA binding protein
MSMLSVTVSPKFQVVIPQSVRAQMQIMAGQKMQVLTFDRRIELLPIETPQQLRGFLAGIDTTVLREEDRA